MENKQQLVISIDVDAFFNTHVYNKYIDTSVPHEQSWAMLKVRLGDDFVQLNQEFYDWVNGLLKNVVTKDTKIHIIEEHDEINQYLKDNDVKDSKCVNIDAHHDMSYFNDNSVLNIENWVSFAKWDKLVKDYIWIHHPLSDMLMVAPFDYKHFCYTDLNNNFDGIKADHIVLCLSKHFTPPEFAYLPLEIKGYCLELKGCA